MRMLSLALAIAATAVPVASAAAGPRDREPEVLARTGKWVVDYDRDACHLYAQFGKGKEMVIARFTRYEPGDWFDFALFGDRFRAFEPRVDAKLDFGIGGGPDDARATHGNAGKLAALFFSSTRLDHWERKTPLDVAPKVTPAQEAAVKGVSVAIRARRPFRLEFGPLDKPLAQLRRCSEDLVKSWGYDPAVQASLLRPVSAITPPGSWLNSSDYPLGALMGGHNGFVQFRLDVDPGGKVVGCYVLARTNPDDFADITCRNVSKRARLQPALDAQGKPVRSYYVQKVLWQARRD